MQTTMIVIGLLIPALVALFFIARSKMKNIPLVTNHEKIITLTQQNFTHQTKNKVVLVDFWASWCAPCRMMAPVLNEVASELSDNLYVGKVDIEEHQSLAQKYMVRSIPTLILFKNGVEINRFVGVKAKDFLIQQIKNA
jgi:thioredoxin 1